MLDERHKTLRISRFSQAMAKNLCGVHLHLGQYFQAPRHTSLLVHCLDSYLVLVVSEIGLQYIIHFWTCYKYTIIFKVFIIGHASRFNPTRLSCSDNIYVIQDSSEVKIAFGQGSQLSVIAIYNLQRNLCLSLVNQYYDLLIFEL